MSGLIVRNPKVDPWARPQFAPTSGACSGPNRTNGRFQATNLADWSSASGCSATPKEMKLRGFIADASKRHGLEGASVAPAETAAHSR